MHAHTCAYTRTDTHAHFLKSWCSGLSCGQLILRSGLHFEGQISSGPSGIWAHDLNITAMCQDVQILVMRSSLQDSRHESWHFCSAWKHVSLLKWCCPSQDIRTFVHCEQTSWGLRSEATVQLKKVMIQLGKWKKERIPPVRIWEGGRALCISHRVETVTW